MIDASQWPWDGSTSVPEASAPPGTTGIAPPGTRQANFTTSPLVSKFAGNSPLLRDAIDHYGQFNALAHIGVSYDDVPFEFGPPVTN